MVCVCGGGGYILQDFNLNEGAINGPNAIWVVHQSSTQRNRKGRERSALPWVCRPERPAAVKLSYLSFLMTRCDVSPFISEPRLHISAGLTHEANFLSLPRSPVPWTAPFVVNRPKSSLRRKSALPGSVPRHHSLQSKWRLRDAFEQKYSTNRDWKWKNKKKNIMLKKILWFLCSRDYTFHTKKK